MLFKKSVFGFEAREVKYIFFSNVGFWSSMSMGGRFPNNDKPVELLEGTKGFLGDRLLF